jgi:phosphoribosyl 1,2-cyclic phosphodiesterase
MFKVNSIQGTRSTAQAGKDVMYLTDANHAMPET